VNHAALDEVRREEEHLRRTGGARAAKEFKGLRRLLLRNWENLSPKQKGTIRELEQVNKRTLRASQLKEELQDIMSMPLITVCRALDEWLAYAGRSRLAPFVNRAPTIRSLPRIHRGDLGMEADGRDLGVDQCHHRSHPLRGPSVPPPRELHHDEHAGQSWHSSVTTVGQLTHKSGRRPQLTAGL
jgi:hypothetical protein